MRIFRSASMVMLFLSVSYASTLDVAIRHAGSVTSDEERLATLTALMENRTLSPQEAEDLAKVVAEIGRWNSDPRLYYFDPPYLKNSDYTFGLSEHSAFRAIEQFYQARMFLWVTLEYGGYWSDAGKRRARLDEARTRFEEVSKAFPDSALVKMYLGTPMAPERLIEAFTGAPEWANAQREGLERLTDIITWWIEHRQRDDGQYGGGWGDDCEMWRWWVPVLIGFDDPTISAAQAELSRGLFAQDHMKRGFTSHVFDVEHTAEDSADTITPMMHLEPANSEWKGRALRLADLFETLWTGTNDRGQLQFKSTYFSVSDVDPDPRKACDTVYHPRAVQPALLYWQRTGDPRLGDLFTRWMDTWVDATAREERGKPAGIIPSAIHWPDGGIGGTGPDWWDPQNHSNDPLYVWPSAMSMLTDTLLLTYHMTQDARYLAPLRSMARIRLAYLENPPSIPAEPGSAMWCASKMKGLTQTLAKYHGLTGSSEFDALLQREHAPYLEFRMGNDLESLTRALVQTAGALRINFPGFTSEVRYTDRVLRFPSLFGENGIYPDPVNAVATPDPELLYSTATGDPGNAGYFPMNAVRWLTPPRDIATLVTKTGRNTFEARLFHFGDLPRSMDAEFYLLQPGPYAVSLVSNVGEVFSTSGVDIDDASRPLHFTLPPRAECVLSITPRPTS